MTAYAESPSQISLLAGARRERGLAAAATAVVGVALIAFGPAPGDAPAHLYRTFLVRHGSFLWDNLWYAGHYPLASYSLLYYLPAALVGNLPVVLLAAVASTLLFVGIAFDEWGLRVRWATRTFAVLAAAPFFTGLYSYSVGFAAMLGALRALQRRRLVLVVVLAALTLGFSPLAFVFLCAILAAVAVGKRVHLPTAAWIAVALAALAAFQAGVLILFPTGGTYPFHAIDLVAVLGVCVLGALLARRSEHGKALLWFFVIWGAGSIVNYAIPSTIGDNWTRLRAFVLPLMLVAAAQAKYRPRPLAVSAIVVALAYNLFPYLMLIPYRIDGRPAHLAFWRPALSFLQRHDVRDYRIEVVPTSSHWESYWVARTGYALARGWYRQLDVEINPVLYRHHLIGKSYRQWLRRMGVRFVLLPATQLDPDGGPREAHLLTSGRAGLPLVYRTHTWSIYRVPAPQPILHGDGARLLRFGHRIIVGSVMTPGTYELAVRFTPYWLVSPQTMCVARAPGGMTLLTVAAAGRFTLTAPDSVDGLIDVFDKHASHCTPRLGENPPE